MEEETFILFKPDAIRNTCIQNYVYEELERLDLYVDKKIDYTMDEKSICVLWDYTNRDVISKYAMECFFNGCTLLLILIRGEKAIEKVHNLKMRTRKAYAVNFYCNCFHAPRNKTEYSQDIEYLLRKNKIKNSETAFIYENNCLKKYSALSQTEIRRNAKKLYDGINSNGIEQLTQKIKQSFYSVYLCNDNEHELVYVAATLYEYVPNLALYEAYMLAIGVEQSGELLIYSSKDKRAADNIEKVLVETGLVIRRKNCRS